MAYNEQLAWRIRNALSRLPQVTEKKMFGSLAFLINDRMCLTAGPDKIMCRIDPALHETAVSKPGCRTVVMRGREYKGYIYVNEQYLQLTNDLDYWITLALDYNKKLVDAGK